MELSRQVRRRTPSPSPSDDEDPSGNHSVSSSPISVTQPHDGGTGHLNRDIPLRQSTANAVQVRKDRSQDKDLSRSQSDIDTDKREKAIDTLTIEFGCEYCQHVLNLGDSDFNKLSSDELLRSQRLSFSSL